jgi:chromosome segregation ATPase
MATNVKRRVNQALGLAKQLTELRKDHGKLVEQLANARLHNGELSTELEGHQQKAEEAGQPYNFLVDQLGAKEREVAQTRVKLEGISAEMAAVRSERDAALAREAALQADLNTIIRQRSEVKALKAELAGAMAQSGGGIAGTRSGLQLLSRPTSDAVRAPAGFSAAAPPRGSEFDTPAPEGFSMRRVNR